MSRNHKPLPEFDVDPAQIPALLAAAYGLGDISQPLARNFGGWLLAVHAGVDETPPATAVRYRKILRRLLEQEDGPDRGQGGYASVKALGAVAALAVSGLATLRGNAPVALASLYITENGCELEEHGAQALPLAA